MFMLLYDKGFLGQLAELPLLSHHFVSQDFSRHHHGPLSPEIDDASATFEAADEE